jgi:NADH:ubiquinone oxidoreductase subunit 5 (subunit L)/multisubunit Na+/H+ antiporter MnhA subunit
MPITFATCLVASLSISGVPPFNGFFSKWMIYQSVIETGKLGSRLWVVWLTVAMFGSGLTLASFMKLLYSTFLSAGQAAGDRPQAAHEAPAAMWLPQAILAALCVIFGVFAYSIPLRQFIAPSVASGAAISYPGVWNAPLATALMLAGIILGLVIFVAGKKVQTKPSDIFIGGEVLGDNSGIKATPFYATIKDMPLLKYVYNLADKKVFDIYEEGTKGTFFLTDILRWLHNGVLPTYLVWCLMGMLVLFFAFVR